MIGKITNHIIPIKISIGSESQYVNMFDSFLIIIMIYLYSKLIRFTCTYNIQINMHKNKHLISIDLFPSYLAIGIRTIHGEAIDIGEVKTGIGIEIGFLFFVITYIKLN